MKLGHYVVIQQRRRLIPGSYRCKIFYRSALDRKVHELLKESDGARLVRFAGCNTTYYIDDDLYRQICALTFNKNDKNER